MNLDDINDIITETNFATSNYKVTLNNGLVLFVPPDENNTDWWTIQEWLNA